MSTLSMISKQQHNSSGSDLQITISNNDATPPPPEKEKNVQSISLCRRFLLGRPSSDIDPRDWPRPKRYTIVLIVALAAFITPCATNIYFPAILEMQSYFGTNDTTINASISVFIFCLGLFPLIWATFADKFGKRPIYIISFLIAIVGMVCCAVSVNVTMFIIFRTVSAVGASSMLSLGAGTIGDITNPNERGRAFSIFQMGPLAGPALGTLFGGYLNEYLGWQSIFWFLAILCFVVWIAIIVFLPETRYVKKELSSFDSSSEKTMSEQQTKSNDNHWRHRFMNPIAALNFMRYPNVSLVVLFLGILFFGFYLLNSNFTRIYNNQYGFDSGTVGLFYLPLAGGFIIGSLVGGRYSDRLYMRRVTMLKEISKSPYPELRIGGVVLYGAMVGLLLAFTAFGWCVEKNVPYGFGLLCTGILGLCLGPPNTIITAYLMDSYRNNVASVMACNNLVRYILCGIGTLMSSDMAYSMGPGPLYTFCGALLFASSSAFITVKLKGETWRQKHRQQQALKQQQQQVAS
ncbi:hypothetical protein O0I10_003835 [Lichtheimia ornata]|uniref:Major facilitator superfamily (MFS) profile domain-containing protein n=1 Tax=Lichtheimia ornata TaxID=688661 RepID=A0AAD7V6T0_9FUNG|nr:uncharacterized protein O0I10_003835 [Lichtheimia ornata]KAJ8660378.1 hypothetical protein O0I10_003835 [Lichtheimia ornata]